MPIDFKDVSKDKMATIGTMLDGIDKNKDGKFSFNEVSKALGKEMANELMDGNKPLDKSAMRDGLNDLFEKAGFSPNELLKGLKAKDADDVLDLNKKGSKKSDGPKKSDEGDEPRKADKKDKCDETPETDEAPESDGLESSGGIEELLKKLFGDNGIDIKDIAGGDGMLSGREAAKGLMKDLDKDPGGNLTEKGYNQLTENMSSDQKKALDKVAGDDNTLSEEELGEFLTNEFSNATGDETVDVSEMDSFETDETPEDDEYDT